MTAASALLETQGLSRRFGGLLAVDAVTLRVAAGSVHGIIGPNGAGKTTLLNLIAGAAAPSGGSIRFEDREIGGWSAARRARAGIARTFQNLRLFPDVSVLENVMVGAHTRVHTGIGAALLHLRSHAMGEREIRAIAAEMLDFVGIPELSSRPASMLSYGQRRLVEIARALALSPRLLLLDEPAAGLTRGEARDLVTLIGRIRARGVTIILVEHHMDVVLRSCGFLTVLHHGRLLAEGAPEEIQRRPDVVEAYFGAAISSAPGEAGHV